tara:strand:- start:1630 stop:1899 length:270 start_codon:yes stop_codon:yes gene_type:complete
MRRKDMKKFAITKDMTTEQRLEVIRKIHAKFNKKLQRNQKVRKTETSFMDKFSEGDNINAYTDAPKYLEEHYGERLRDQNEYESYEGWN